MKLQQLRFLIEVADSNLNVTVAAERMFTSQPGVSKQVRQLEEELGITVFERNGKRFIGITAAGAEVIRAARRVLLEVDNLKRTADDQLDESTGTLTVATTHTQARYVLPRVVAEFTRRFPKVKLSIREGDPHRVTETVLRGEADIGIATESLAKEAGLVTLPAYTWHHLVIAPLNHPVLKNTLSLKALAKYPLITYDPMFSGRSRIDAAFKRVGVMPNLVLTAVDSDVIKTYVSLGLGIGIIAEVAYDAQRDNSLGAVDAGSLFGANMTRVGLRRGVISRKFALVFLELLSPQLSAAAVAAASRDDSQIYDI
ncbi:HTH-type transcriptional regulator SsuR [Georgfuchsia toluolica]|uniref:HTH-type transcriptional regulator SsuR n=1 Tax=Georgfuchsia toluolica TaxID=424218 RepID=A0A916N8J9_9PROT|nr:CysB family HTH-type transcriptional regulator [Georgfuchsia toluolica]CAG4882681.1 HTH-type transcriptional regulator SsuR [Georgfuchsia toluolica]